MLGIVFVGEDGYVTLIPRTLAGANRFNTLVTLLMDPGLVFRGKFTNPQIFTEGLERGICGSFDLCQASIGQEGVAFTCRDVLKHVAELERVCVYRR
jgi:hypothetical protein